MTMEKALVAINIEAEDGGEISEATNVVATISGPAEAVFGMLDALVSHPQAEVLSATAEDANGNITPMRHSPSDGRMH